MGKYFDDWWNEDGGGGGERTHLLMCVVVGLQVVVEFPLSVVLFVARRTKVIGPQFNETRFHCVWLLMLVVQRMRILQDVT